MSPHTGPSQALVLPSPQHTNLPSSTSELQVLQVSPARSNFHFNTQPYWELDGIFHLVLDNLCDLQENTGCQMCTSYSAVCLSIAGLAGPLESAHAFTHTDLPPLGMQPFWSWWAFMNGETVWSQWYLMQHRVVTNSALRLLRNVLKARHKANTPEAGNGVPSQGVGTRGTLTRRLQTSGKADHIQCRC